MRRDLMALRARDALVAVRTELINTMRGLVKTHIGAVAGVPRGALREKWTANFRPRRAICCCHWCRQVETVSHSD